MNPYDFVHIDWQRGVTRRPLINHAAFQLNSWSGIIEGTITAKTPLFIKGKSNQNYPYTPFLENHKGNPIIPGTSLKGLFRNLVETIGPGCWLILERNFRDKVPVPFRTCHLTNSLCVACRIFGMISRDSLLLGHVGYEDAICTHEVHHDPIYTPILVGPKTRHTVWYMNGQNVAGRKYYFHDRIIRTRNDIIPANHGAPLNQYIAPLGENSTFSFKANFDNLADDDFKLLLYAMVLERCEWGQERDVIHKIGYGKPAGLGSIQVDLTKITLLDYHKRYTDPQKGITVYEGNDLINYLRTQTASFTSNTTSTTLQDLRRIWGWPPPNGVLYGYPTRQWFDDNPTASIANTLNSPIQ